MVWTYYCADDDITLAGDSREELAERLMDHVNEEHEMEMTYDDALASVDREGKQEAA
jgi:predicted small metal-binding protein